MDNEEKWAEEHRARMAEHKARTFMFHTIGWTVFWSPLVVGLLVWLTHR